MLDPVLAGFELMHAEAAAPLSSSRELMLFGAGGEEPFAGGDLLVVDLPGSDLRESDFAGSPGKQVVEVAGHDVVIESRPDNTAIFVALG